MDDEKRNTVTGLTENVEALLCYVCGWISGLIFFLLETKNAFVRFHALQSLVCFLGLFVLSSVLFLVPVIGAIVTVVMWPLSLVLWVFLMVKAWHGEKFKLPVVGDFVEKQLNQKF